MFLVRVCANAACALLCFMFCLIATSWRARRSLIPPLQSLPSPSFPPRVAVLLTTWVTETRRPMYAANIQRWLDETELPIYCVDSCGEFSLGINHPRLQVCTFRQADNSKNSTVLECASVAYANARFGHAWGLHHDFIFKVTGKYVPVGFERAVNQIASEVDIVLQHRAWYLGRFGAQNSEVWGARPALVPWLADGPVGSQIMESFLHELPTCHSHLRYARLPRLELDQRIPRADGFALGHL